MTTQARDKIIMMFLPAVAIVSIYIWRYSQQGMLIDARVGLEKARVQATTPEALAGGRARLATLQQEQEKVRGERQELDQRWQALTMSRNRTPAARAEAFQRLSKLIWQGGLFTVEEAPQEGTNALIPVSLDEMFKKLANNNPTGAAGAPAAASNAAMNMQQRLWKVRFLGRYRDVTAMLETLSNEQDSPIIPVSITMAEAPLETDWRSWTLLVWM